MSVGPCAGAGTDANTSASAHPRAEPDATPAPVPIPAPARCRYLHYAVPTPMPTPAPAAPPAAHPAPRQSTLPPHAHKDSAHCNCTPPQSSSHPPRHSRGELNAVFPDNPGHDTAVLEDPHVRHAAAIHAVRRRRAGARRNLPQRVGLTRSAIMPTRSALGPSRRAARQPSDTHGRGGESDAGRHRQCQIRAFARIGAEENGHPGGAECLSNRRAVASMPPAAPVRERGAEPMSVLLLGD